METKKYFLVLLITISIMIFLPASRAKYNLGKVRGTSEVVSFPEFPLGEDRQIASPEPKGRIIHELAVEAEAALVVDKKTGMVLYEKNSRERLPIASLTKLLTAILVAKNISPTTVVQIKKQDLDVPDFRAGLLVSEKLTALDLLSAMLISSANDAAMALARATSGSVEEFVRQMNQQATNLGMKNSLFSNPVGFDDLAHYSTAKDLSLLVEEFLQYPDLVRLTGLSEAVIYSTDGAQAHKLITTNKLLLKHEEVRGLKTGYTTEAKGNLILLVEDGEAQYYLVILGSQDREAEAEKIFNWVRQNFAWN